MKYFIIAFVFAGIQLYILKMLLQNITAGNRGKSLKWFFAKLALYGVGIYLFVFKFIGHIAQISCGFIAGLPICAFVYFIYVSFIKKKYGDSNSSVITNIKRSIFKKKSFRR